MPSTSTSNTRLGPNASTNRTLANAPMANAPMAASVPASIILSPAQAQLWHVPATTRSSTIPIDICLFDGVPGSGKTFAACLLALQHARENPGQTALIVAKQWATLRDSSVPQLFALLDQCQLTENVDYYYHRQDRCLQLANGSALYFRGLQSGLPAMACSLLVIEGLDTLSEAQFTRTLTRLQQGAPSTQPSATPPLRCLAILTHWPGEANNRPPWLQRYWPGCDTASDEASSADTPALPGFRWVKAMAPCAHVAPGFAPLLVVLKALGTGQTKPSAITAPVKAMDTATPITITNQHNTTTNTKTSSPCSPVTGNRSG
jgi:hypothetical protein